MTETKWAEVKNSRYSAEGYLVFCLSEETQDLVLFETDEKDPDPFIWERTGQTWIARRAMEHILGRKLTGHYSDPDVYVTHKRFRVTVEMIEDEAETALPAGKAERLGTYDWVADLIMAHKDELLQIEGVAALRQIADDTIRDVLN